MERKHLIFAVSVCNQNLEISFFSVEISINTQSIFWHKIIQFLFKFENLALNSIKNAILVKDGKWSIFAVNFYLLNGFCVVENPIIIRIKINYVFLGSLRRYIFCWCKNCEINFVSQILICCKNSVGWKPKHNNIF